MHAKDVFVKDLEAPSALVNIVFHIFEHFFDARNDRGRDHDQIFRPDINIVDFIVGNIRHQREQRTSLAADQHDHVLDLVDIRYAGQNMVRDLESDLFESIHPFLQFFRIKNKLAVMGNAAVDDFLDPVYGLRIHADKDPGIVIQVEDLIKIFRDPMIRGCMSGTLRPFAFLHQDQHTFLAKLRPDRNVSAVVVIQVAVVFDEFS